MTPTEQIREEFNTDCVLVRDDCIRIYYYADAHGKWFPANGGPLKGETAMTAAASLADRINKYRDLLPIGTENLPLEFGEMASNGKFTRKVRVKCPK